MTSPPRRSSENWWLSYTLTLLLVQQSAHHSVRLEETVYMPGFCLSAVKTCLTSDHTYISQCHVINNKSSSKSFGKSALLPLMAEIGLAPFMCNIHCRRIQSLSYGYATVSRYQKGKTNLDCLEQETVSGSAISWAICKSAPWLRQITMHAPYHSDFAGRIGLDWAWRRERDWIGLSRV